MAKKKNILVAIYRAHTDLDSALKRLKNWGFNMGKVSLVGRGYINEAQLVGCYLANSRMKHWGELGTFWDEYWGMLSGAAFFSIPGTGPVLVAGPLVSWIVAGLKDDEIAAGLNAIGVGLKSVAIPRGNIEKYETSLKAGNFLLLVHGAVEEITEARDLLHETQAQKIEVHSSEVQPAVGASHFFG
jgi:hypothetical protein